MSKKIKQLGILGLILTVSIFVNGSAQAANGPFVCSSNFYQVIGGQLKLLNPTTGIYSNIGSAAGFNYNAIGYNSVDNYIYGLIIGGSNSNDLVRVGADGTVTDLGVVAGFTPSLYVNGAFDFAGNLYVHGDAHTIFKINVANLTATAITISGDVIQNGADNVFIDNKLYLLVGSSLSVVDLNTNNATTTTVTGPSGWLTAGTNFGAGWTDSASELFFSNNESGSIYQITNQDSANPVAVFKVTGTVTSNNDGASCALSQQSPFDPPVAVNDSYATPINTPLDETSKLLLNNDMGNVLTVTAHNNPTNGLLTLNADGSFVYTPNNGYVGTDSFAYTVTDSFGRTSTATVTITVTPKPPVTGIGSKHRNNNASYLADISALFISIGLYMRFRSSST